MSVKYINNYPNIIIFAANNPDGIVASYLIKEKYDNNLQNDLWQNNVHVYLTERKEGSIREDFNKIEQKVVKDQRNIIFLINPEMDANSILKIWNWTTDRGYEFVWLDNNIENIQEIRHLNIPGKQSSRKSTATLTYEYLNEGAAIPRFFQVFDEAIVKNSGDITLKEKEALPLYYFVQSLGNNLNENTNDFLFQNLNKIINEEQFLNQAIQVGKFVYNHVKLQQQKDQLLNVQSQQQVQEIIKNEKI